MKRFRRLLALPLIRAAVMMAGPARAGDIALLESLGFSEAGDVFAFQQSGVEDGSGFPYADIFFLDLILAEHFVMIGAYLGNLLYYLLLN